MAQSMKDRFVGAIFGDAEQNAVKPLQVKVDGLRKARSRQILHALDHGVFEKANHKITRSGEFMDKLTFFYRGTPIAVLNLLTGEYNEPFVGEYEDTVATKNQRKVVKEAVQEVFGLVV